MLRLDEDAPSVAKMTKRQATDERALPPSPFSGIVSPRSRGICSSLTLYTPRTLVSQMESALPHYADCRPIFSTAFATSVFAFSTGEGMYFSGKTPDVTSGFRGREPRPKLDLAVPVLIRTTRGWKRSCKVQHYRWSKPVHSRWLKVRCIRVKTRRALYIRSRT